MNNDRASEPTMLIYSTQEHDGGMRLDLFLSEKKPEISRSTLQKWIKEGHILINKKVIKKCNTSLQSNQEISIFPPKSQPTKHQKQNIALNIVFEDENILVINKPPGLVCHPGAGQPDNTLMNALLNHHNNAERLPRAGIIHRLDKMTSGLLVCAKNEQSQLFLIEEMTKRKITREYEAVVIGNPRPIEIIDKPIGRSPHNRIKMSILSHGKKAITHITEQRNFTHYAQYLKLRLETGRTHQIRVHLQSIKHPILNDEVYGHKQNIHHWPETLQEACHKLNQHALHAKKLELTHPITTKPMVFKAKRPEPLKRLIDLLNDHTLDESCA